MPIMHAVEANNPSSSKHWHRVKNIWEKIAQHQQHGSLLIDGDNLDIASVVAVARYGVLSELDRSAECRARIQDSVDVLNNHLAKGHVIYGVTTGFGGSADTRTQAVEDLQSALLQHLHIGVLTQHDRGIVCESDQDPVSHAMPRSWVRGMILVRCNSIMRGHSAVSLKVIEAVNALNTKGITPVVPLRGSISASGDLSPLSYVAGAVTANPDIMVQIGRDMKRSILPADLVLEEAGIQPVVLGPKEGLGLINGTAASAAVGSLALFDCHNLILLSQVLTSMSVEALLGSYGSFHEFIAQVRPHQGQGEVAENIRFLLQGSRFARGLSLQDSRDKGLFQDRYPLRTSSQWLGPQIEDLLLAHNQITTELNSTTDNPLVDVPGNHIHHGGNFQATSITSAMEKARLALQMIGKLLFAQCSEVINPMLNNGLPPNLSADEPSLSFTCKGIDTSMASYMSELTFLADPVSNHVQSAEMHNQAVNSLALISARYTQESAEMVKLMAATHLYVLCQALDLRAMNAKFLSKLEPELKQLGASIWNGSLEATERAQLDGLLWQHIVAVWSREAKLDSHDRAHTVVDSSLSVLTNFLISSDRSRGQIREGLSNGLAKWKVEAKAKIHDVYATVRSDFFVSQDTLHSLGRGAAMAYKFIRQELGVPFNQGLVEYPRPGSMTLVGRQKKNIGSWISLIHESLQSGRFYQTMILLKDAHSSMETTSADANGNRNK